MSSLKYSPLQNKHAYQQPHSQLNFHKLTQDLNTNQSNLSIPSYLLNPNESSSQHNTSQANEINTNYSTNCNKLGLMNDFNSLSRQQNLPSNENSFNNDGNVKREMLRRLYSKDKSKERLNTNNQTTGPQIVIDNIDVGDTTNKSSSSLIRLQPVPQTNFLEKYPQKLLDTDFQNKLQQKTSVYDNYAQFDLSKYNKGNEERRGQPNSTVLRSALDEQFNKLMGGDQVISDDRRAPRDEILKELSSNNMKISHEILMEQQQKDFQLQSFDRYNPERNNNNSKTYDKYSNMMSQVTDKTQFTYSHKSTNQDYDKQNCGLATVTFQNEFSQQTLPRFVPSHHHVDHDNKENKTSHRNNITTELTAINTKTSLTPRQVHSECKYSNRSHLLQDLNNQNSQLNNSNIIFNEQHQRASNLVSSIQTNRNTVGQPPLPHQANETKQMQSMIEALQGQVEKLNEFKQKYESSQKQVERIKLQFAHSEKIRKNQQTLIELQSQKIAKLKGEVKRHKADNQQLWQIMNKRDEVERGHKSRQISDANSSLYINTSQQQQLQSQQQQSLQHQQQREINHSRNSGANELYTNNSRKLSQNEGGEERKKNSSSTHRHTSGHHTGEPKHYKKQRKSSITSIKNMKLY